MIRAPIGSKIRFSSSEWRHSRNIIEIRVRIMKVKLKKEISRFQFGSNRVILKLIIMVSNPAKSGV